MRIILLSLLVFCSLLLVAQAYEPVFLNGPVHFKSQSGYMIPYRIDSIVHHGDTTDYYSFNMIRPLGDGCQDLFTLKGGSWIGKKISHIDDSTWYFYNKNHKPIIINPLLVVNQSWILYPFPNGSYIEATVISKDTISFLGISDSVKTIEMVRYNADGEEIDSFPNRQILQISKNYGFLTLTDFYNFPDWELFYPYNGLQPPFIISGFSNPLIGYQNINTESIFSIPQGNEIHAFEERVEFRNYDLKSWIKHFFQSQITSDSIYQIYSLCLYEENNTGIIRSLDTVHLTQSKMDYGYLDKLAYEPCSLQNSEITFFVANENYKFANAIFSPYFNDTINWLWECFSEYTFFKELSGPYEGYSCFSNHHFIQMVYLKTQNFCWGTPFRCESLLHTGQPSLSQIDISPNPVADVLYVSGNESISAILIYDQMGKLLVEKTDIPDFGTDISFLPAGLYLLQINTRNGVVMKKFMKM